jgi:hypothetical protein
MDDGSGFFGLLLDGGPERCMQRCPLLGNVYGLAVEQSLDLCIHPPCPSQVQQRFHNSAVDTLLRVVQQQSRKLQAESFEPGVFMQPVRQRLPDGVGGKPGKGFPLR